MKLTEPSMEYGEQIMSYRQEFLDSGDSMDGTGALESMDDPQEWIRYSERCKDPAAVPQGLVPATQYIFVREDDWKIVGMIHGGQFTHPWLPPLI